MDRLRNICCYAPMMVYATPEAEAKVDKLCLAMVTLAAQGWSVDQLYYYALKHGSEIKDINMVLTADSKGLVIIFRSEQERQEVEEYVSEYF
ncbi:hypothetical protein JZO77_11475 [Enterococcus hulanensis]|uniref:hypothetical protein n=1 Tax=Enterococcus TaxID=1350 RepID=UPI000B6F8E1D|nr:MULTISPECIES: hypothetical protein [Enterococcus]MBO0410682.1 hypothetical protein [Enterococcus hulanensis]MBO0457352.1 hypothetical protein [Enterococcus hulanensis]OTO19361.1 hypothetical protein A5875_000693 [Enterococcus sp. 3H8_DIV0648]